MKRGCLPAPFGGKDAQRGQKIAQACVALRSAEPEVGTAEHRKQPLVNRMLGRVWRKGFKAMAKRNPAPASIDSNAPAAWNAKIAGPRLVVSPAGTSTGLPSTFAYT